MRRCSEFIPLHVAVHFSKNHLLKDCIFSVAYSFLFCHRVIDHKWVGLFLDSLLCSIDSCVCFCARAMLF